MFLDYRKFLLEKKQPKSVDITEVKPEDKSNSVDKTAKYPDCDNGTADCDSIKKDYYNAKLALRTPRPLGVKKSKNLDKENEEE